MKTNTLENKIKNWSLAMGILYLLITISFFSFYLGFWILGLKAKEDNELGISILKATPFLYHFFLASLLICIVSFIIFAHYLRPFGKEDIAKNQKIETILFAILTLGFFGFVIALPMLYLWLLLLKKTKQNNKETKLQ